MIYFALRHSDGAIKIGTTNDVARRLAELQVEYVGGVELLVTEPGSYQREAVLHGMFRSSRLRGEWFALSDSLAKYMASLIDKPQDERAESSPYERKAVDESDATDYVEPD